MPQGRGTPVRVKAIAFLVIVAASGAAFYAMHSENRADAAKGDCYASDVGPSTPTICS
jgi:hypothetical protein